MRGKDPLGAFHPSVREWFRSSFDAPTPAQARGWPPILAGRSTLLLAPTGSGKTLAAFLAAIDRLLFTPEPPGGSAARRTRVLYVSPLRALAFDVERNLRAPIAGIAAAAERAGIPYRVPEVALRTGDTPPAERARMLRRPPDILITTPESLYLILTSRARETLVAVETVIVDEIHSIAGSKRGSHLSLSLERLERLRGEGAPPLQRIGLSATQRPLVEVARLLAGGVVAGGSPRGRSARSRSARDRSARGRSAHSRHPASSRGASDASPAGRRIPHDRIPHDWIPRDVAIVDAGRKKRLELVVEVPREDGFALGDDVPRRDGFAASDDAPPGDASGRGPRSIWPSIYPRLVELIRAHRSTMVFVNNRRLAERLAASVNDAAGSEIALAHHGSVARERRLEIEDRLKRGDLPAIVATSSLELGIDMGAVDLVIQIEAPPSVASGMQRVGRASHSVGAVSRGVIFPKHRGDLLPSAAAVERMKEGAVEETRYPRNPLDVLAQQIVAIAAVEPISFDDLLALVRRAAPFADLPLPSFEGVLDMLAGRYPSDEFAELRPRIVWDRVGGIIRGREGARRLAVTSGGTIPDRGLYGVFLVADEGSRSRGLRSRGRASHRVGELDEEMVFESREGDVFLLGASSWRIEEITHDQVLVSPAPGQPGKMPFWHGDRIGRPLELGRAVGALARVLSDAPEREALRRLRETHGLDRRAATSLLSYLRAQIEATGAVPSDRTIVVERTVDEVGDWRVCVLSPFGGRVHAAWATAVLTRLRERTDADVEMLWSDDGMVFRLPETGDAPQASLFVPESEAVEDLIVRGVGGTSLFAARFRENAARALLIPRRHPGRRSPLWAQRKKARDLLAVASRYGSFPVILETYRECLRDVFDLPGLVEVLRSIESRRVRVVTVDSRTPSPFASSLLFSYVANFIYDGDMPLAERKAQALTVDPVRLRELLGEAVLRDLLDPEAIADLELSLLRLDGRRPVSGADDLHDLLLAIGDLTREEIRARLAPGAPGAPGDDLVAGLSREGRIFALRVSGEERFAAAEDAARFRDAIGAVIPPGLARAFLEPVADPLGDLISRYARTHGPFTVEAAARRFALGVAPVRAALERLAARDRVLEGELLPGGRSREWCDAEVLRILKRRSLAKLRKQVEPVEQAAFGRFLPSWQGVGRGRRGLDALISAIDVLQGSPLHASALEGEILPARVEDYDPADLDRLTGAGEAIWRGLEPVGPADGRIALYFPDRYRLLAPPAAEVGGALARRVLGILSSRGASFFADLREETGAFAGDLLAALWELVWAGRATNDTLAPLRSLLAGSPRGDPRRGPRLPRSGPPGSEGRWSILPHIEAARGRAQDRRTEGVTGRPADAATGRATEADRRMALAETLIHRHGILTREGVAAEGSAGGFSGGFAAVYPVLKALEEAGRIRRGYFIEGLGATQFAAPGAEDHLRSRAEGGEASGPPSARLPSALVLAAADPANPYGAALPWPRRDEARLERRSGAQVFLHDGRLVGFLARAERDLWTFLPQAEPERGAARAALAGALAGLVEGGKRPALLLARVDGGDPARSALGPALIARGFAPGARGYLLGRGGGRASGGRGSE